MRSRFSEKEPAEDRLQQALNQRIRRFTLSSISAQSFQPLRRFLDRTSMSLNSRLQVVGFSNQVACGGPHVQAFLWERGVLFDLNRLIVNRSTCCDARHAGALAIEDALKKSANVSDAARRLGIGKTTLYWKLRRYEAESEQPPKV